MIEFKDEVISGEPKYVITHADNTQEKVSIELYNNVVQQGTPLNKLLFDSIKNDVNARELLSNKTTTISSESTDTQYPTAKAVFESGGGALLIQNDTSDAGKTITFSDYPQYERFVIYLHDVRTTNRMPVAGSYHYSGRLALEALSSSTYLCNGTYDSSATSSQRVGKIEINCTGLYSVIYNHSKATATQGVFYEDMIGSITSVFIPEGKWELYGYTK